MGFSFSCARDYHENTMKEKLLPFNRWIGVLLALASLYALFRSHPSEGVYMLLWACIFDDRMLRQGRV